MGCSPVSRRAGLAATLSLGLLALYVLAAVRSPYGGWDAWGFWNTRAKFFLLDPAHAWSPTLSHADYPPLLPLLVAWGWRVVGLTPLVPLVLHGLIFAGLLALLGTDAAIRRRLWPLALVGLAVLPYSVMQVADLALAAALLGATRAWQQRRPVWIGGALGIAVLLKNEGLLMALAWLLALAGHERRVPWAVLGALTPWLLVLVGYKLLAAAPNDVLDAPGAWSRLLTPGRYLLVGTVALGGLVGFGSGALLLLGGGIALDRRPLAWTPPLTALALTFAGYLLVYLVTPHPLLWHLYTSIDRLVLHLFPSLVVGLLGTRREE